MYRYCYKRFPLMDEPLDSHPQRASNLTCGFRYVPRDNQLFREMRRNPTRAKLHPSSYET